MFNREEWEWTFLGFESAQEGKPVQFWWNGLPRKHRVEAVGLFLYLRRLTRTAWGRPFFDPLDGEGGISEIIVPDIRDELGVAYYRIYEYFGPAKQQYTFLHGVNKKARNDRYGKAIAKRRLKELERQNGAVHSFDFEG